MTRFVPGGRDLTEVDFRARLADVRAECATDEEEIELALQVILSASRGPANAEGAATFDYFVAVASRDEEILARDAYSVTIPFEGNRTTVGLLDEVDVAIPLAEGQTGREYRIFVGLALTAEANGPGGTDTTPLESGRRGQSLRFGDRGGLELSAAVVGGAFKALKDTRRTRMTETTPETRSDPRPTPLAALHREQGGKLVDFAGALLPLQFPAGIMAEHKQCRDSAALFDVSHMGQVELTGSGVAAALERLVPGELQKLPEGRQRYTFFTNAAGGILDDLIVARLPAAPPAADADADADEEEEQEEADDLAHLRANLPGIAVRELDDRALIALQGPKAVEVLTRHAPAAGELRFLSLAEMEVAGVPALVSRSGYT
ncbi:gcvT, partial [Symbiodinium necroappetens]